MHGHLDFKGPVCKPLKQPEQMNPTFARPDAYDAPSFSKLSRCSAVNLISHSSVSDMKVTLILSLRHTLDIDLVKVVWLLKCDYLFSFVVYTIVLKFLVLLWSPIRFLFNQGLKQDHEENQSKILGFFQCYQCNERAKEVLSCYFFKATDEKTNYFRYALISNNLY